MPSYEFECVACSQTKDVIASIHKEIPEQFCEFDGCKMYKVYSSPPVIFNASGFYGTRR